MVKENIEQAKNEFSAPLLPILDLNEESNMVSKEVDFFGSSSQSSNILDVNYDRENIDNLFFSVGDTQSFSTTNQALVIPPPDCNYVIDEFHIFNPDTRSGTLTGFHSTARLRNLEQVAYDWVRPITDIDASNYETFSAEFFVPDRPDLPSKTSSFFPQLLRDTEVLGLIGQGYIKSGCKPTGDWRATVTNPLTGWQMPIEGFAQNYLITSAFPSAPQNIF